MKKGRQIYLHVLGCLLFLALPVFLSPDFSLSFDFVRVPFFQEDFFCYALLLLFFYLNYFIFIPRFYFKKEYIYFIFFILLSYLFIVFLPQLFIIYGNHMPMPQREMSPMDFHRRPPFGNHFFHEFGQHFFQFVIVLIFSMMLKISGRWKQTEKEKLSAELSYLKAQINPHFLFNTLNSIYSLAIEKSDNTASAVVKLSEMMRYVTTEANQDFVSLEKELSYISNYMELQKIRFGNTFRFVYSITGDGKGKNITPLILIPFVENAFKHGVNPEEDSEIHVSISIQEETLHLAVFNKKVKVRMEKEVRTEQGIENTKNRLQHLYPAKHLLVINNEEKTFSVALTINLK